MSPPPRPGPPAPLGAPSEPAATRLIDLGPGLERDREALRAAFDEVLAAGTFVLGPFVERFERELAAYCGVGHAVGVASGSDALELALRALGVGPGDAVVTSPFTFVATAEAIAHAGARPLFADVEPDTWLLDLEAVDRALSRLPRSAAGPRLLPGGERVRAVMPVHLFGAVVDAGRLREVAARHGLWVVEDAAQALGGSSGGRMAGALGAAGCLSFFPTKTLGALGDGGAVLTDDAGLAREVRALRQHGCVERGRAGERLGRNSRLDALQAALLSARLGRLPEGLAERRALRRRYHEALAGLGPEVEPVGPAEPCEGHAAALMVVRARRRDELARHLAARGVGTGVYYDRPLHACAPYLDAPRLGPLPAAERAARESLALPLYPGLDPAAVGRIAAEIEAFARPAPP
jgi:dTDP-4-amino-4,6-dideoxygalactose transaminase